MHGQLQLRPSTRVVTTVTTTTVHYEPIEIPVPDHPVLSGEYRSDRTRFPLEMAGDKLGSSIAMPTMLGMADFVPSGSDRKGKRRLVVDEDEAGAQSAKRRRVASATVIPSPVSSPMPEAEELPVKQDYQLTTLLSMKQLVGCFSTLSPSLQTHTLHQLLRQAPTSVIQSLNNIIQPALKRDFISDLPPELAVTIFGYLNLKSIITCLSVSRYWKSFIDGHGEIWSKLMKREGLWTSETGDLEAQECERLSRIGTRKRNGQELSIRDLLSMGDGRAEMFHKRWRAGVWNENFDEVEAAKPTHLKLPRSSISSRASTSTLRRTDSRPQIAKQKQRALATTNTTPPPESLPAERSQISPYKLLYKKRKVTRRHWYRHQPPHRTSFPALHNSIVTALQFDNDRLVTASNDYSIEVYDPNTGSLKNRLTGHTGGVWALQFIGNILVSGATDRSTRVWDLETGRCTHIFTGHKSTVRCLQIVEPVNVNPNSAGQPIWEPPCPLIVTGSRDTMIRVWKLPSVASSQHLSSLQPYVPWSPSESSKDARGNPYHLRCLEGHTEAVRAVAAHGRRLVSGSYDCTLRVWDLLTGECQFLLTGHTEKVYSVTIDDTRNRCASGSLDGSVRIWSLANGDCVHKLDGHSSLVGLLENSLQYLVSAGADSTIKVWNPDSGKHISTLSAHAGAITCFKHDAFRVISGTDGQLRLWDIRRGRPIRDLMHDMNGVWQVSFNDRFVMAAVQRGGLNDFEILDFFPELRPENATSPTASDLADSLVVEAANSPEVELLEQDQPAFPAYATPVHQAVQSVLVENAASPWQNHSPGGSPDGSVLDTSEIVVGGSSQLAEQNAEWEQVFERGQEDEAGSSEVDDIDEIEEDDSQNTQSQITPIASGSYPEYA